MFLPFYRALKILLEYTVILKAIKKPTLLGLMSFLLLALVSYLYFFEGETKSNDHEHILDQLINGGESYKGPPIDDRRGVPDSLGSLSAEESLAGVEAIFDAIPKSLLQNNSGSYQPTLKGLQAEEVEKLKADHLIVNDEKLLFDRNGRLNLIELDIPVGSTSEDPSLLAKSVETFVGQYPALFGLKKSTKVAQTVANCSKYICSVSIDKEYQGLPAWDHSVIATIGAEGIVSMTGEFKAPELRPYTNQVLSAAEIKTSIAIHFETQLKDIKFDGLPAIGVARVGPHDFYAYRVQASIDDVGTYEVTVDIDSKKVRQAHSLVFEASVDASGQNLAGEQVDFNASFDGSMYQLVDTTMPLNHNTTVYTNPNPSSMDSCDSLKQGRTVVSNLEAEFGWDSSAVSAVGNFRKLVDYFKENHNYDAVDPQGKNIAITVNIPFDNAAACGDSEFFFGSGVSFNNMAGSLDVMAHEIAHGVIFNKGSLNYSKQSGALNESFADFFGAIIDDDDWLIGEDVVQPYLRNMASPSSAGGGQLCGLSWPGDPAHMMDYVYLPDDRSCDNGGVHINSGIPNRALYLMAEGLAAENLGQSIGRNKVATIVFETIGTLPADASFNLAAAQMSIVANEIFGELEKSAIDSGWASVGIPSENTYTSPSSGNALDSSPLNALVYLKPYYSTSTTGKEDNKYYVYLQLYSSVARSYESFLDFGHLNDFFASYTRPSYVDFGDQSGIFYTDTGNNLRLHAFPSGEETLLIEDSDVTISKLALSPDKSTLLITINESPSIYIMNIANDVTRVIDVSMPTYTDGLSGLNVDWVDSIRFDATSRKAIFDFRVCDVLYESDCSSSDSHSYWSIGVLDIHTGNVSFPLKNQPSDISIGFPSFSNLSNKHIVFDMQIEPSLGVADELTSLVAVASLEGELSIDIVALTDYTETSIGNYGMPSFTADDSNVVFATQVNDDLSMLMIQRLENYIPPEIREVTFLNPSNLHAPISEPLASVDRRPSLKVSTPEVNFGFLREGELTSAELCVENNHSFPIRLFDISTSHPGLLWTGTNQNLSANTNLCGSLQFDTSLLPAGAFSSTFSLIHDGSNSPTPVAISVIVDIDTDNDGILNHADNDDDGDGVDDVDDAFPLDPSETSDLDGDGIGDIADTDDDGDGVSDDDDVFPQDGSETSDFDGDGIGDIADTDDGTWSYIRNGNNITVTGCSLTCPSGLVLPENIINYPVTAIAEFAFKDLGLTSVTIPYGVIRIGDSAFSTNALTNITIPNTVTTIGDYAFYSNEALSSLELPDSLVSIGYAVFYNNALTSIEIPNTVTTIGDYAFRGNSLTSLEIPNSVMNIGDYAFASNEFLSLLKLPDSLEGIGEGAFYDNALTSLEIPSTVTTIGDYAFRGNSLTSLEIPNSVMNIGDYAFAANEFLSLLKLPDSLESIGEGVFYNNALTSIEIPNTVTTIGDNAFRENSLTSLEISNSATSIGNYAFFANNLSNLVIANSVESIGDYTFAANNLLQTVSFTGGRPDLADTSFSMNSQLNVITFCNGMIGWPGSSISNGTDYLLPVNDCDNDGVEYPQDAFPLDASESVDSDGDGVGDNTDHFPLQPQYSSDSDDDLIPDSWEIRYGLNPNSASDALSDHDNDGVSAYVEFIAGSMPLDLFDIDGNGKYDALSDGQLLLRSMYGFNGDMLIDAVVSPDARFSSVTDIESRIEMLGDWADVDGDGQIDALTDGIIILRYLFGFRGDLLVTGVLSADSTRTNSADIEAYLNDLKTSRVP